MNATNPLLNAWTATRKSATLDRQIDNLVELYDLTPEEIAIIESSDR